MPACPYFQAGWHRAHTFPSIAQTLIKRKGITMSRSRWLWLGASALPFAMILLQPGVPTAPTALAEAPSDEMKLKRVLPTDADQAWRVALSADGKKVVTGSYGPTAILWDAAAGKPLHFLQEHAREITSVALSADGKQVVTGSYDKTAMLWDAATGKRVQTFEHDWPILSVALSDDGKHLVTGSRDKPSILWETATGKKLQTIGRSNYVMALSANGKHLVTSSNQFAMLWDTASGENLQTFQGHAVGINCLTLSADGKKVLTVDTDPSPVSYDVIVWEAASGKKLQTIQVLPPQQRKERPTWVRSVALSVEGDQIITGCEDGTTNLWDAATGKKLHTFAGHTTQVLGVALSADGKHAWTASFDGTTRLWDTSSGKELCALLSFEAGKDWLVVTPEGFFDGSEGGCKRMSYREPGTSNVLNDDATRKKFYCPGLLGTLYRGEKPKR
jgi:WD40 repeat protein